MVCQKTGESSDVRRIGLQAFPARFLSGVETTRLRRHGRIRRPRRWRVRGACTSAERELRASQFVDRRRGPPLQAGARQRRNSI